jgi:hypothetical protein
MRPTPATGATAMTMTFEQARKIAIEFGCSYPQVNSASTQGWIDRVEWLHNLADKNDGDIAEAIHEVNRYLGK